ncbi:TauD/TfdA family dioxygenase [Streptomyces sp. NBC_01012]|uniref:TauD/TfdA family dioxygenase n=1 Tax=Streptomyces sp. NBC_01012 TaxID=2903717 RepID=UPI0038661C51|nr:TauD/TfdA family dioxygenase [Streptomyces sp. NBC_01012]
MTSPDSPAIRQLRTSRCSRARLLRHASSPNCTIQRGWNPGDFVPWDNRATWHDAMDEHGDGARVYRKVIGVEREEGATGAA